MARTECATRTEFLFTASPANARPVWNTPGPSIRPTAKGNAPTGVLIYLFRTRQQNNITAAGFYKKKKQKLGRTKKGPSMRLARISIQGTHTTVGTNAPGRKKWHRLKSWDAVRATMKYCNLAFPPLAPRSTICGHHHGSGKYCYGLADPYSDINHMLLMEEKASIYTFKK